MTSEIFVSDRLARSRLVAGPCRDDELAKGYETGDARTRRASPGRTSVLARISSRFIPRAPRKRPSSPDAQASLRRKREMSGPSELPTRIRGNYTAGEQAVLVVVVREVMKKGCCDLCIDQIAAMAGVGRTTVQNALRKARDGEAPHVTVEERPRPGRKNLTNVIRIISKEWMDWLKRRIGFKALKPTLIPGGRISLSEIAGRLLRAHEADEAAISPKRNGVADAGARRDGGTRWHRASV